MSERLTPQRQIEAFMIKYAMDPVQFVRDVFGATPDPWQQDVMNAKVGRKWHKKQKRYVRVKPARRISVASCHGPGKTAVIAWLCWHQLMCLFPQKTAVTAPSRTQMFDAFYAEMKHWHEKLPPALGDLFDVKADTIVLKQSDGSKLSVRTARADTPEALQGIHCEEGWVLLIADEASGVPEPVYESAAGSMSGKRACTVLLGNPTRSSGLFFDTHHKLKDMWYTKKISAFDSPRVTQDFITDMARRYGEDSNAYRVRVLGEFPITDDDSVIPYGIMDSARKREIKENKEVAMVWGLDVARFGSDSSALVKRRGSVVPEVEVRWKGLDTMQLTGAVKSLWDDAETSDRPASIYVDAIGIGAGVADRLRELGLPIRAINVAESPAFKDRYRNLRAELWFLAKEWLQTKVVSIPEGGDLGDELTTPKYFFASSGKLQVEGKADIKKRSLPSPDVADAFVLTFADGGAILAYGAGAGGWNQEIRRNIKGVV